MKQLLTIDDREQTKRQQITDSILTNLEDFRTNAARAYHDFIPVERKLLASIETNDTTSYNVLAAWDNELRPLLHTLHSKLSAETFRAFMVKNLVLNEKEAQTKIDQIITERKSEVLRSFIYDLYPIVKKGRTDINSKQRERAKDLLSRPESDIEQIRNHQIDYMLYKEAAAQNHITVADSHASLFKRIRTKARIRAERKKILAAENNRLLYITKRLRELSAMNGGLLINLLDKKMDLMVILDLRNRYEKKIAKLSPEEAKNAVKRLAIFDSETLEFKKEQIEKLVINSDQTSLETTRAITRDIDTLLLRIFDLTTTQKNQLLLHTKEYRELTQEQTTILQKTEQR